MFSNATIIPSTTKNTNIPAVPDTEAIRPSLITLSSVVSGLNPDDSSAPAITPINREE